MAAALLDSSFPEVLDLTAVGMADLDPLMSEEVKVWDRDFSWDFRVSADLLRRYLHLKSLYGRAMRFGPDIAGYAYHVCEGRKGLIGDFYVREEFASPSNEMLLLGGVVESLILTPGVKRIESQLMLLRATDNARIPFGQYLTRYDRRFMCVERRAMESLTAGGRRARVQFGVWAERWQEEIAHLVAACYRGHIDSEINDQYRSIPGARHFLANIIRYPGCGRFIAAASQVAIDETTGRLCGVCLCSLVSANSGHITQLCVLPGMRGAGVGRELLSRAVAHFAEMGCRSVSLTVTSANDAAIGLYESLGFESRASFPALVWDGF
jgi:ribosomal protein S18 acetylase RimI-like enzyme